MSLISGSKLYPGHQAVLFVAQETGAYPYVTLPAAPAVGSASLVGYFDVPEVNSDEGSKPGYGCGSPEPLYDVPGLRTHDISFTVRVADPWLLVKLINSVTAGGTAEFGEPDFCVWFGVGTSDYFERLRFVKFNSIALSFREGSGQEVVAQLSGQAIARETESTPRTLSLSSFNSMGAPLTWHNMTSVLLNNIQHRDQLSAFDYSKTITLDRTSPQNEFADDSDPLSRTSLAIKSTQRQHAFSVGLHSPKIASGLVSPTSWGSGIVLSAGNGVRSFGLSIATARLLRRTQQGGDPAQNMMGALTAVIRNVTASGS